MGEYIKNNLSDEQKTDLHTWILDEIRKFYPSDYSDPTALIDESKFVQNVAIDAAEKYLRRETGYKITERFQ